VLSSGKGTANREENLPCHTNMTESVKQTMVQKWSFLWVTVLGKKIGIVLQILSLLIYIKCYSLKYEYCIRFLRLEKSKL
jgi:hypothetical protein